MITKSKTLLISNISPFKVKDGVSAALSSLFYGISMVYDEVDVYVITTNIFYKGTNDGLKRDFISLNYSEYSVVFISPITSMLLIANILPEKRDFLIFCQISDCIVYELWRSFVLSIKYKDVNIKPLFKIPYYYYKEFQIRNISDIVLLQTDKDERIFNKLYFTSKGNSLPNSNLLDKKTTSNRISVKNNSIGWCATFQGEYLRLAKWFFKSVLSNFLSKNKKVFLSLVGRNNKVFYSFLIMEYPKLKNQIRFNGYVEDLKAFNSSNKVVITPVFKGYGLINKTVEAMASGVVVIGDKTAFNGIENCISYKNCILAEKVDEFTDSLDFVFNKSSKTELDTIGFNARLLIYDQFTNENYVNKINAIIRKTLA